VLVVVEDRDVDLLAQALLDGETLWRFDVLEIDATEGGFHHLDGLDEFVGIGFVEFDVEDVDVGEALEQDALPSMTGFDACAPMSPSPSTAEPFETTPTRLPLAVYWYASVSSASISRHGAATPGEYASERSRCVFVGSVVEISIFRVDRCGDTPVNPHLIPYRGHCGDY